MNDSPIRVAVVGYGVIGKRVADAISLQGDMRLTGVAEVAFDYRIASARHRGYDIFAATSKAHAAMGNAGIEVAGRLGDLLAVSDVVVDATPKGVAGSNLPGYRAAGVKVVVQGGEPHDLTGHSFVAQANYDSARGRDATRVVSCNTTSVVRTLGALQDAGLLESGRGVLMRRATDPWESDRSGIMNTIVPERSIPSHQGPDAQTVRPELDVVTMAAKAAHTQTHNHYWVVRLRRSASRDEVLEAFRRAPRIAFIRVGDGIVALNSTIELMKDLDRPRGDMWEVALWEDILKVEGEELFYTYQVDNQAIVVPEAIDAVRALGAPDVEAAESIRRTDEALGLRRDFVAASQKQGEPT